MGMSAFGVDDNRISKAASRRKQQVAGGAAGAVAGGTLAAVASPSTYRAEEAFDRAKEHKSQAKYHDIAAEVIDPRDTQTMSPRAKQFADRAARERVQAASSVKQGKRLLRITGRNAAIGAVAGGAVTVGSDVAYQAIRNRRRE